MKGQDYVWLLWDTEEQRRGDSREPELVAIYSTLEGAQTWRELLLARPHPQEDLGYAYSYEVEQRLLL